MKHTQIKIITLTILLTSFAVTIFGAAEHAPLKKLANFYAREAHQSLIYISMYTKCLENHNFKRPNCDYKKELIDSSQKLKTLHEQIAQQSTPEQYEAITGEYKNLPFNILTPESPEHFEKVLMLKRLSRQYSTYALFKAEEKLQWRRCWDYCIEKKGSECINKCELLQNAIHKTEQEQHKLKAIFYQSEMADLIVKHEPEFHAEYPDLFADKNLEEPAQKQ